MSLVEHFLPHHLQTPANIKYFHSLLSLPFHSLEEEKKAIQVKIEGLEGQIKNYSIHESKEFVSALGSTSDLVSLSSRLSVLLENCSKVTNEFKEQVISQSSVIEGILLGQQKLENLSNLQSVINEIIEIPSLLKNLVNSRHYKDALELIFWAEKINAEGQVFENIRKIAKESRKRIYNELLLVVSESFDCDKVRECFKYMAMLNEKLEVKELFLNCKKEHFKDTVKRQTLASIRLVETLEFTSGFLEKLFRSFSSLFGEDAQLIGFIVDIVSIIFQLFLKVSCHSLSELAEVSEKLSEINRKYFIGLQCDIWPEVSKVIEKLIIDKLELYKKKTLNNFENLVKLYSWQVTAIQTSPLQEFGSISVLYNNCLIIINEIRAIPLESVKPFFFQTISQILKSVSFLIHEKTKNLLQSQNLNKQEDLQKSLMIKYINCLTVQAVPEIIKHAMETFEDSEEYRSLLQSSVEIMN